MFEAICGRETLVVRCFDGSLWWLRFVEIFGGLACRKSLVVASGETHC